MKTRAVSITTTEYAMENGRGGSLGKDGSGDRRLHVRHDASALPQLSARLPRGPEVRLIDVSRRGALIETSMRLPPGRKIDLCFVTTDDEITLTGCVVRSTVSAVSGNQIRYRSGLSFGEDNPLVAGVLEKPADTAVNPDRAPGETPPPDEGTLTLLAAVDSSATEFRQRLIVNDW